MKCTAPDHVRFCHTSEERQKIASLETQDPERVPGPICKLDTDELNAKRATRRRMFTDLMGPGELALMGIENPTKHDKTQQSRLNRIPVAVRGDGKDVRQVMSHTSVRDVTPSTLWDKAADRINDLDKHLPATPMSTGYNGWRGPALGPRQVNGALERGWDTESD